MVHNCYDMRLLWYSCALGTLANQSFLQVMGVAINVNVIQWMSRCAYLFGAESSGLCGLCDWNIGVTVNPVKLETGLRPNGAGIPYTLLLRIEAIGFPISGLLL